jgi:hypothetical protein
MINFDFYEEHTVQKRIANPDFIFILPVLSYLGRGHGLQGTLLKIFCREIKVPASSRRWLQLMLLNK